MRGIIRLHKREPENLSHKLFAKPLKIVPKQAIMPNTAKKMQKT